MTCAWRRFKRWQEYRRWRCRLWIMERWRGSRWRGWYWRFGRGPWLDRRRRRYSFRGSETKVLASFGTWPQEAGLVRDLMKFIRHFVVVSEAQALVIALWVIHTYCVGHFVEQTPYLAVTSPERQCGKSRLLEVLELVAARAWMVVLPSEAVVYRHVHAKRPTLLLDEVDAIFDPRTAHHHEGLRAILNAGHRNGAVVPRCVGTGNTIIEFRVFSPKVVAAIGTLPDTIADRSIPIRLQRKRRDEKVRKFIRRAAKRDADKLVERIEAWVAEHAEELRGVYPEMPEELSDRMQEGCECLVVIADALGIGAQARGALVELFSGERWDNEESVRLRLLGDLKAIFEEADPRKGRRVRALPTATLLMQLINIAEGPWASYYGRPVEDRDLASLLRPYGVTSTTIRSGSEVAKGYKRDDLQGVWQRYL